MLNPIGKIGEVAASSSSSTSDTTVPYIVGAASAGVVLVVLIWYVYTRIKVQRSIRHIEGQFVRGDTITKM